MKAIAYLHPRPDFALSPELRATFDQLFAASMHAGAGEIIAYDLPAPKWQFLCYAADSKAILLHGSGDRSIEEFTPRQPLDLRAFGAQKGVFATSDGIWSMFYAIVDRDRYSMMIHNACVRLRDGDGQISAPYYFFSVSHDALAQQPYRSGAVYFLPRTGFTQEPEHAYGEAQIIVPQWMNPRPVRPLAKLLVDPEDFPFLSQIRGHDDEVLKARIAADPFGFPWIDEQTV